MRAMPLPPATARTPAPGRRRLLAVAAGLALGPGLGLGLGLAGCATPVRSKVTTFHNWPADAAGASFGFLPLPGELGELEQATYQDLVGAELMRHGLRPAQAGESPRFVIELAPDSQELSKQVAEPIWQDAPLVVPGYWSGGLWVPPQVRWDPFGPRYVGDRIVTRTFQRSRLRLVIRDAAPLPSATAGGATPARRRPLAVFEARAVIDDDEPELAALMPYLVRGIFEGFPGASGRVRLLRFERAPDMAR